MKYGDLTLGQLEAVVNKLGGMEGVKRFLRGESKPMVQDHIIDLSAEPYVPEGWCVEKHIGEGTWKFNAEEIDLFLADGQKNVIVGNELSVVLEDKPVLNANILDYLLKHTEIIPKSWKGKDVYFWGTIYLMPGGYSFSRGHSHVCCLYWKGGRWRRRSVWLAGDWGGDSPAAVRKSRP